jgi:LPXTG-site transpeptidase (sortase) family protein
MKLNRIHLKSYLLALFLLIGGLGGSSYYGYKLVHSQSVPAPVNSAVVAPQVATQTSLSASQPVRLVISKIGVDAPSINLNLKADGTLETPNSPTEVGWYRNSPTPGEKGPAIMTAHVDYINYGPAVFWNLGKMTPGDTFEVNRMDGTTAKFKVDSIKQFTQDNFPTNEVYGDTNDAEIRLITCSGSWNSHTHHYSDNTVVFGSLVN